MERTYTPPSLAFLAAQSAAAHLHKLLPAQLEDLAACGEDALLALLALLIQRLRLTPALVSAFQLVAETRQYAALAALLASFDVSRGYYAGGADTCSGAREIK
jgi:hypothetical protein